MKKNEEIDTLIKHEEENAGRVQSYINNELYRRKIGIQKDKTNKYEELKRKCFSDRSQFKSFNKYKLKHSGSSENHLHELKNALAHASSNVYAFQELNESYKKLYEKELIRVDAFVQPIIYKRLREVEEELAILLNEIIVGNEDVRISKIIKELNNKKWVEEGFKNYVAESSSICPFCQSNSISQFLIDQFNSLFNEAYTKKIKALNLLRSKYLELSSNMLEETLAIQTYYNDGNSLSDLYVSLRSLFDKNVNVLNEKLSNPNEMKSI